MAKSKQKKLTLKEQYQKQINRLQRYQKKYEKLGYKFTESLAPSLPDKVTRPKLEKIKSIKPRKLRGRDTILTPSTGEVIAEKIETDYANAGGWVDAIESQIKDLSDVRYTDKGVTQIVPMKDKMLSALYDTLAEYDEPNDYERYLSSHYEVIQEGLEIIRMASKQEDIYAGFVKALVNIKGSPLTREESEAIVDYIENY